MMIYIRDCWTSWCFMMIYDICWCVCVCVCWFHFRTVLRTLS